MSKLILALAVGAFTAVPMPALAADTGKDTDPVAVAASVTETSTAVVAGIGLGVPVATVRAVLEKTGDYRDRISQNLPDTGSPANLTYGTLFALPAGLLAGLIDGPFYGCRNAFQSGIDHPFSAESFSLGDNRITPQ